MREFSASAEPISYKGLHTQGALPRCLNTTSTISPPIPVSVSSGLHPKTPPTKSRLRFCFVQFSVYFLTLWAPFLPTNRPHTLSFYADRLCITHRYLSRVIQQVSGTYAKEWIDRAIVPEAKVILKHSNLSVAAIAEELHFANPSFFNKYFKRLTGMTPNGYREKE